MNIRFGSARPFQPYFLLKSNKNIMDSTKQLVPKLWGGANTDSHTLGILEVYRDTPTSPMYIDSFCEDYDLPTQIEG